MTREEILELIDQKVEDFLVREEKQMVDLFDRVKQEEADRLNQLLEGIKTHTARISALENQMQVVIQQTCKLEDLDITPPDYKEAE